MDAVADSSIMFVNVDIPTLFYRVSADVMMFMVAMITYWILHHVKTKKKNQFSKATCKDSPVDADEDFSLIKDAHVLPTPSLPAQASLPAQVGKIELVPKRSEALQPKPPAPQEQPVFNASEHLALMQKYAAARNIKDTLGTFRLLQRSGECLTSAMYNAVIKAWIKCGNVWAAEGWLEQAKEASLADEGSFILIIQALVLVQDFEKVYALFQDMKQSGVQPSVATFDELLVGYARAGLFDDGIEVLKDMDTMGIQPTSFTLSAIAKLVSSARHLNQKWSTLKQTLTKYDFDPELIGQASARYPSQMPLLSRLISAVEQTDSPECIHDIEIKGSLAELNAFRRTLSRHSFLGQSETDTCSLDGERDVVQDHKYCARIAAVLKCVSKQGLCLPLGLEESLMQFLGSNLFYLRVGFNSYSTRADIFDDMSCRHPRMGFRHCWVNPSWDLCGQRTFVNGEETDEACFNRHINAVQLA